MGIRAQRKQNTDLQAEVNKYRTALQEADGRLKKAESDRSLAELLKSVKPGSMESELRALNETKLTMERERDAMQREFEQRISDLQRQVRDLKLDQATASLSLRNRQQQRAAANDDLSTMTETL